MFAALINVSGRIMPVAESSPKLESSFLSSVVAVIVFVRAGRGENLKVVAVRRFHRWRLERETEAEFILGAAIIYIERGPELSFKVEPGPALRGGGYFDPSFRMTPCRIRSSSCPVVPHAIRSEALPSMLTAKAVTAVSNSVAPLLSARACDITDR